MPKTFRLYAPDQMLLLASSAQERVPEGDMAHFISDIVDALDRAEVGAVYEEPASVSTLDEAGAALKDCIERASRENVDDHDQREGAGRGQGARGGARRGAV
jgi:hypothetical protein